MPLLSEEKKEVEELLPATTSEEDKETIFGILGQAMCRPTGIQVEIFCASTPSTASGQRHYGFVLSISFLYHSLKNALIEFLNIATSDYILVVKDQGHCNRNISRTLPGNPFKFGLLDE